MVFRSKDHADGDAKPLIVFVHVPKTAGSTVNAALHQHLKGISQGHDLLGQADKLRDRISSLDWISGHADIEHFLDALHAATPRKLRFFSAVRDPISHVASHYNWLIEIFHKGKAFYQAHPESIRAISETLRSTDNTNPKEIIRNLKMHRGLFLNQQARTVLGPQFKWQSGQLPKRLRLYEYVATEATLPNLIERLTGDAAAGSRRENSSRYHVDPALFQRGEVRNFLLRNNYHDWVLYQTLRDPRMRAAISAEFADRGKNLASRDARAQH